MAVFIISTSLYHKLHQMLDEVGGVMKSEGGLNPTP